MREVQNLENKPIVNEKWLTFLVIAPLSVLYTSLFYWIFLSLIRTMQQLTLRRQVLKLQMYKALFGALVISGVIAGFVMIYIVYEKFAELSPKTKFDLTCRYAWLQDTFWEILLFGILATIAVLWRPRSNNTRYGYAEFFTDEENGDPEKIGEIPLETINVAGGELIHRKKKKQEEHNVGQEKYDNDREKNIEKTKLKLTEFEKDILNFELPSDDEVEVSVETQIKKMD